MMMVTSVSLLMKNFLFMEKNKKFHIITTWLLYYNFKGTTLMELHHNFKNIASELLILLKTLCV